jgi:hypothetical protein
MKKRHILGTFVMALAFAMIAGTANALLFQEEFLGNGDSFSLAEPDFLSFTGIGNQAKFFFDLAGPAGPRNKAVLIDTTTDPNTRIAKEDPSIDETSYDTSLFLLWATIDFWLNDYGDFNRDRERIRVNVESRNTFTYVDSFRLENVADNTGNYQLSFDLNDTLLSSLADGDLLTVALAPNLANFSNTFQINRVRLTAEADTAPAPVPEPGTLMLLGIGLFGLGMAQRRRMR